MRTGGSHPATPQSSSHRGKTSPTPPPPPPKGDMAAHMKLHTFKGVGDEDMDMFWFVANVVWTTQNFNTDVVKRAQLVMELEGHVLDLLMG